jgi:hypothetical protein
MRTITKLEIFDFDGTLVDTPLPDEGKDLYQNKTGKPWPHQGWWGRVESLDTTIFDMKVIPMTKSLYLKAMVDDDSLKVMLTGRLRKLSKEVETVLQKLNLTFDEKHYNNGGATEDSKMKTINDILERYPLIEFVTMADDRLSHIPIFTEFLQKHKDSGRIKGFKINVIPAGRD